MADLYPHIPMMAAPSEEKALADLLREKGLEPKKPVHSEVSEGVMIDLGDQETFDAFQKKYADQIKAGGPISIDAEDEKKFRKLQVTE